MKMKWKEMPENGKRLIMILTFIFIMFFVSGCMYGKAYAAETLPEEAKNNWNAYYETQKASYGNYYMMINRPGNGTYAVITHGNNYRIMLMGEYMQAWRLTPGQVDAVYKYDITDHTWKKLTMYTGSANDPEWIAFGPRDSTTVLASNTNIYQYNSTYNSTDVFFSPPFKLKYLQPQLLTPVLGQVVSLLPILLICLVGFLGLRKALSILQAILHQA